MFKLTKYTLIVAAAVAAVGAPSSAYAVFVNGRLPIAPPAASVSANPTPSRADQLRARYPARGGETSGTRRSLAGPAAGAARHGISSSNSFQWGDAGVGAAVVLVLISVGSRAAVVIRRRVHHPLAS
jgi:hypothetical protein